MDNKLNELSKPVAWFTDDYLTDTSATTYSEQMAQRWREKPWFVGNLYSQEYVSALLAELERYKKYAKECDEENEALALTVGRLRVELQNEGSANAHAYERIRGLEKRLATPVRLPDVLFVKVSGHAVPIMHADRVNERVRAAGFNCVGDE